LLRIPACKTPPFGRLLTTVEMLTCLLCFPQDRNTHNAGTTLLSGYLPDQAALQGVLLQIIRLGLTLLSLETSEALGREETEESRGM
jgi:hypothetical protein